MKKYILNVLFLSLFACSCNFNILAADGDGIPEYSIDSEGVSWFGKSADAPANNENLPADKSESSVNTSENNVPEENVCNQDLDCDSYLLAKIKSIFPNLNMSDEQLKKIITSAAVAGVSCVASYVGYKIFCKVAKQAKSVFVKTCKSAAIFAVIALIAKFTVLK